MVRSILHVVGIRLSVPFGIQDGEDTPLPPS